MRPFKGVLLLLNIAVIAVYLYYNDILTIKGAAVALLFYCLGTVIHLSVHELGHLIGGTLNGYKLLCLRLGPMNIVRTSSGRPSIFLQRGFDGQCIMIPEEETTRFLAYNIGGIISNFAVTLISAALLIPFGSLYMTLFLLEVICIGIRKLLVNAIPHKTGSTPNDGYVIKLLTRSSACIKDYTTYLRLYKKLFLGEPISRSEFYYEREPALNSDELLYYNEICDILDTTDGVID